MCKSHYSGAETAYFADKGAYRFFEYGGGGEQNVCRFLGGVDNLVCFFQLVA